MFHFRFVLFCIILVILALILFYGIIRNIVRICKGRAKKRHWLAFALCLLIIAILAWGFTKGFDQFTVEHVEYASTSLPQSFDGYKIVLFSDVHAGTFTGKRQQLLRDALKTINAQNPDAIFFCGDIENKSPAELVPFAKDFRSLKARDGVYSVMGNHDYSLYLHATELQKKVAVEQTKKMERSFGWHLLLNDNAKIGRNRDTIYIAGEENQGKGPFPKYADVRKTMKNIPDSAFVIMMQHDPCAWKEHILPETKAQMTLSGHTHAGQFMIFGWSAASLLFEEYKGAYYNNGRMLYVTSGLGGVIPFRFGVPGEIVVITLKRK